jgi:hypothetical protein
MVIRQGKAFLKMQMVVHTNESGKMTISME